MRNRPYGMIVVGGPTGSGRFTTVRKLLLSAAVTPGGGSGPARPSDRIVTCEDAEELLRGHPAPTVRRWETRASNLEKRARSAWPTSSRSR